MAKTISITGSENSEKADKSVRFSAETDRKFTALAAKTGRSKQELFALMVDYFYKSKKDPADLNDDMLKKEITQGINRIISFIKTQENDALVPLLAQSMENKAQLEQLNKWRESFTQWFLGLFYEAKTKSWGGKLTDLGRSIDNNSQNLIKARESLQSAVDELRDYKESKEALKAKYEAILEHYIEQREALNGITQGKQIKDLQMFIAYQFNNI
jgi:predicted DNA-binding protein